MVSELDSTKEREDSIENNLAHQSAGSWTLEKEMRREVRINKTSVAKTLSGLSLPDLRAFTARFVSPSKVRCFHASASESGSCHFVGHGGLWAGCDRRKLYWYSIKKRSDFGAQKQAKAETLLC
jgi:hypothetical protein